jgi:hypothetical protein
MDARTDTKTYTQTQTLHGVPQTGFIFLRRKALIYIVRLRGFYTPVFNIHESGNGIEAAATLADSV